jgi:hypothetical protein
MSITFSVDRDEQVTSAYECLCVDGEGRAREACRDCGGRGTVTFVADAHAVNFANGNAFAVLAALGLEPDYCGEIQTGELTQRLNAVCFRVEEPQLRGRLFRLRDLAVYARATAQPRVVWG